MPLQIMLVDESRARAAILDRALSDAGHEVVARLGPGEDLFGWVERARPDVIIVDLECPDRDTLEHLHHLHRYAPRPVLMFSERGDRDIIVRAIRSGVSAYVVDGLSATRIQPLLEVAIARFREFQALRCELETTRTQLADRKTVDRAKGMLMMQRGLTEPDAYAALRKLAMDRNQTLGEAARNAIAVMEALG